MYEIKNLHFSFYFLSHVYRTDTTISMEIGSTIRWTEGERD